MSFLTTLSLNMLLNLVVFLFYNNVYMSYIPTLFSLDSCSLVLFFEKIDISVLSTYLITTIFIHRMPFSISFQIIINLLVLLIFSEIWILKLTYTNVVDLNLQDVDIFLNTNFIVSFSDMYFNIFSFFFDKKTLVFSTTTLVIGLFASLYSNYYLAFDKNKKFFFQQLNVFILSMVFLVKTNSFALFFLC